MLTVMVGLVVTRWATLLVVLIGWGLPIGASSLGRVGRGSLLLLLALLLVALLLAVAGLLGLVARLLLAVRRGLGVTVLVVTSRLAVGIVTNGKKGDNTSVLNSFLMDFPCELIPYQSVCTSVGQWEQPAGRIQDKQTGQCNQAENHKTGKQLEQQRQECCHIHWLHSPGLTGGSYDCWTGQQGNQLWEGKKEKFRLDLWALSPTFLCAGLGLGHYL